VWTKRKLIRVAATATGVAVIGALVVIVAPLIAIATAYKAQMLSLRTRQPLAVLIGNDGDPVTSASRSVW